MDNRATLEMIAPTIEEAVEKGLEELGLREEDVDIEVLDTGSKGLFGLGTRHARVRLTIKSAEAKRQPKQSAPATPRKSKTPTKSEAEPQTTKEPAAQTESKPESGKEEADEERQPVYSAPDPEERIALIARATVEDLLDRMHVIATVDAYWGEPDDERSKAPLCVDITGNDLSILIGRHAETLNALQYVTALILGKELEQSIPLVIDVEGYRKRREEQIRTLARQMADQAIRTGRRQILEPMPANERRIVHIELRNNEQVTTESIGEPPRRKVTVIPKEN
jgi:spoIIIJ-associated protein